MACSMAQVSGSNSSNISSSDKQASSNLACSSHPSWWCGARDRRRGAVLPWRHSFSVPSSRSNSSSKFPLSMLFSPCHCARCYVESLLRRPRVANARLMVCAGLCLFDSCMWSRDVSVSGAKVNLLGVPGERAQSNHIPCYHNLLLSSAHFGFAGPQITPGNGRKTAVYPVSTARNMSLRHEFEPFLYLPRYLPRRRVLSVGGKAPLEIASRN
ncbi:hypothetical protein B0J18DRAFT_242415 [Chaetomium sp. MPI-SDFR-AT-0129]|nr:hypothetical protein B0J18DRAFT_242415 [Chaetomium sp. MPI-SDFR-AT-0129]